MEPAVGAPGVDAQLFGRGLLPQAVSRAPADQGLADPQPLVAAVDHQAVQVDRRGPELLRRPQPGTPRHLDGDARHQGPAAPQDPGPAPGHPVPDPRVPGRLVGPGQVPLVGPYLLAQPAPRLVEKAGDPGDVVVGRETEHKRFGHLPKN
ncbi:hypothetical protein GCM10009550_31890 [Actinocorallia libanotica]|uniref:Uncharacterized protein n=1 Tax=Actinocorallia libanotica TaxID=46162 RepID=A0ABP4BM61_9ACTN